MKLFFFIGEQVAKEVELQKAQEESNNKIIALNPKAKETPKGRTFVKFLLFQF